MKSGLCDSQRLLHLPRRCRSRHLGYQCPRARLRPRKGVSNAGPPRANTAKPLIESNGNTVTKHVRDDLTGDWAPEPLQERDNAKNVFGTHRVQGVIANFFLPKGDMTPDYLVYQLWALPCHVTGWISNSLVTSSLLKAAGLGTDAAKAVAAGAAMKWITKDGIGALGRYVVGGSLARFFDEDPRYWRFVADCIKAGGLFLEIFTAANPGLFILLAGSGNFALAVGKGISRPSFRVIQQHFARTHNIGAIAAKEEVWEVTAQLIGLGASLAVLQGIEQADPTDTGFAVIVIWFAVQIAHIALRYVSLSKLQLPWISQRRAAMLASTFVAGEPLPDVKTLSQNEPFVLPKQTARPYVLMNSSVTQLQTASAELSIDCNVSNGSGLPSQARQTHSTSEQNGSDARPAAESGNGNGARSNDSEAAANVSIRGQSRNESLSSTSSIGDPVLDGLLPLLQLFEGESYVLVPSRACQDVQASVRYFKYDVEYYAGIKEHFDDEDALQLFLQAAWHQQEGAKRDELSLQLLKESLEYAKSHRAAFCAELTAKGFDAKDVIAWSTQENVISY